MLRYNEQDYMNQIFFMIELVFKQVKYKKEFQWKISVGKYQIYFYG